MLTISGKVEMAKKELALFKKDSEAKESVMKEQNHDKSTFETDLKAARAKIGRVERVIHNFAERLCTCYNAVMRAKAADYCVRLNAVLIDALASGEFLGGFRVRVEEERQSLRHGNESSNEDCKGPILRRGAITLVKMLMFCRFQLVARSCVSCLSLPFLYPVFYK